VIHNTLIRKYVFSSRQFKGPYIMKWMYHDAQRRVKAGRSI